MLLTPIIFKTCGVLGLLAISRGVLIRASEKRDRWFIFGGLFLLIYSVYLKDLIFIILQSVYIVVTWYHWHQKISWRGKLIAIFK
ncbi:MAG: hypothetical protein Q7K39_01765 [Candidatus Magasanikbacteria bacterium]|nr:hypothetical protein [Candidatus Magasanikbacteria bacterium]